MHGGNTNSPQNGNNNKLERDFQISKHHLISQKESQMMGQTIVSGNKLASVDLFQKLAIVFLENICNTPNITTKSEYAKI